MTEGEGRLVAGRYRLRRSLGQGGMGVVWLAYDEYLEREVAVKEILPRGQEVRDTDPQVRRALREARAAAKLSKHPGIITIHDVVTDDSGLPWIVMEVLHGRSLRAALDTDGPMRVDQAARTGAQVLSALDYAHQEGVLHRDVKPGNVMLVSGEHGDQAVLTDFGIAVLDGVSVLTATGQLPGSPEYVAPERIRGEEALPAADLWSVGVMLYGMVVGRTPFQRADIQATMGAALSLNPDPDPRVGRLAPVIEGLLRKRPAERMTAKQAIAALTAIAATKAPANEGPSTMGDENTDVDVTMPDAPIAALPSPHSPPPPRVAPDDPTVDPQPGEYTQPPREYTQPPREYTQPPREPSPPPQPRSRRGPLVAGGAFLVVVAVVVAIVLANGSQRDESTGPTTTTTDSQVPLTPHRDPLGFEIDIPPGWQRTTSPDDQLGQVTWESPQEDPTVGALTVQVRRDTTAAGVPALTYLTTMDQALRENREYLGYESLRLRDRGSSAELEYTYQSAAASSYFHEQVTAWAPGDVYTLKFLTFASDADTLAARWQDAAPLFARIRDSFRPS